MSIEAAQSSDPIVQRYQRLAARIELAIEDTGCAAGSVRLLAVSKRHPAESVRSLARQGLTRFGENYLSEALEKMTLLGELDLEWHFIGPLQSNKTRDISTHFDWVQSVDRTKLVTRLNDQRPTHLPPLNVLMQVNLAGEARKAGASLDDVPSLASQISDSERLSLRGLMMIPPLVDDPRDNRAWYRQARTLFDQLANSHPAMDTLSMGMSGDLEVAIDEGSTMIRVGTDLFGPRL